MNPVAPVMKTDLFSKNFAMLDSVVKVYILSFEEWITFLVFFSTLGLLQYCAHLQWRVHLTKRGSSIMRLCP